MKERIEKLRERFAGAGVEALYITNPENRFYLSGFTGTAGSLLLGLNNSYLFTDFRYTGQAARECPDYQVIETSGESSEVLREYLTGEGISLLGLEGDYLTYNQFQTLKEKLGGVELKTVDGLVEELRARKDKDETAFIEEAVRLADEAFKEVLPLIRPGVPEREVALQLEYFMRRLGAEGAAFKTIVASGYRSALPHGVASSRIMAPGDFVTLDFGAVYNGYHSDITRTVVLGRPEKKQEEIYQLVLEAQMSAIESLRAGIKASDVDGAARRIIEQAGYGKQFGHGTGHGVGLSIHEKPRLSAKDQSLLEEGMVVTIEPGIYLPGWGGVRIEDTVLVLNGGCRVLTRTPKENLLSLS
ncbi:MAG: M24 family metallopeptidase [Pelotomaculaceae bacterium]|nr:Xaa-Pro peptidase family protein [Bacillota bacterium]HHU85598.1 aminopeptidase P family protein [Peptococcaceae bacterium]